MKRCEIGNVEKGMPMKVFRSFSEICGKHSANEKILRIAALISISVFFALRLSDPRSFVTLHISRWNDVVLYSLFICAFLFAVILLISETLGYKKLKFTVTVVSTTALSWFLFSLRNNFVSMDPNDTLLKWLLNNLPMYLFSFTVVFLFGKFVLFKKPQEE